MPKGNRPKQRRAQENVRNKTAINRNAVAGGGGAIPQAPMTSAPMPNPGLISGMLGTGVPSIAPMPPPKIGPAMPPPMRGNIPGFVPSRMQSPQMSQMPMGSVGANALGNTQPPMGEEMMSSPQGGMFKGLGRLGMY